MTVYLLLGGAGGLPTRSPGASRQCQGPQGRRLSRPTNGRTQFLNRPSRCAPGHVCAPSGLLSPSLLHIDGGSALWRMRVRCHGTSRGLQHVLLWGGSFPGTVTTEGIPAPSDERECGAEEDM